MKRPTSNTSNIIQTGIVGFGLSGQVFHAPFIDTHASFHLNGIVSSGTLARQKYPGTRILSSLDELLSIPEIDLVILSTPNSLHFSQARAVLEAGKHVIVEKPMAVSVKEAETLLEISKTTGKRLFPFHNRRWDSDFLTLQHILQEGYLGEIVEFESRFDRYTPEISRAAWRYHQKAGGGTLFDLGTHLIDQAICLFGKPQGVFCRLYNQRNGSVTDDSFDLKLIYPSINVTLKAGVFAREPGPRYLVHGKLGSYLKYGLDTQETMLRAGMKPSDRRYGREPLSQYGLVNSVCPGKTYVGRIKALKGNYMGFFNDVLNTLTHGREPAVKPEEALLNLRIIEAAMKSNEQGRIIPIE